VRVLDGTTRAVYDKQRRWFSEVLKVFGAGNNYSRSSRRTEQPVDTLTATPSSAGPIVIPAATISTILGASSGQCASGVPRQDEPWILGQRFAQLGLHLVRYGAVQIDDVTIDKGAGAIVNRQLRRPRAGWLDNIDNRFPAAAGSGDDGRVAFHRQAAGEYFLHRGAVDLTTTTCAPVQLARSHLQHRRTGADVR